MKKLGIFAVGLALVVVAACSDKESSSSSSGTSGKSSSGYTDHSSPYPACDEIIKACHPLDVGEGTIHDCHDQGHGAKSDNDCIPVKEMCLKLCKGGADAGAEAGSVQ